MTPRAAFRSLLAVALLALAAQARADDGDWDEPGERAPSGGYDVQVDVETAQNVTLEQFQEGLSPHGSWVTTGYGTAWRPRVAAGWRPYYYGRWEWTNEGWLWVSEEPFGWATYHYGRWAFDGGYGWVWVPGYQWAPAWVSWRFGGDVVGWAPLAPGLSLYVTNYAFVDFWWTFVPSVRFCGTPVWGTAYPPTRAWHNYGATRPAPPSPRPAPRGLTPGRGLDRPPGGARPTPGWGGPPPRYIEERTGRPVSASRIVVAPRPGASAGRAGEIGVYRPELAPRHGGSARPAPADRWQRPSSPAMPGSPRQGSGWDRGAPPATRVPGSAPAPRSDGRVGPAPSAPRYDGRPAPTPSAPRQDGRPAPRPSAPRQEGRSSQTPTAPRYDGRAAPIPSAPRHEGRPAPMPSAPPHEGRAAPMPSPPRFESRPGPAPRGSVTPSSGAAPRGGGHARPDAGRRSR